MPSENFDNQPSRESALASTRRNGFSYPNQADNFGRRTAENYNYKASKPYDQSPSKTATQEKDYQDKLERLQGSKVGKKLAKLGKAAEKKSARGIFSSLGSLGFSLFRQIDMSHDWLFLFALIPFAFLKDIFDMVFAALTASTWWIPFAGAGFAGAGIVFSFVLNILLQLLAVVCLVLVGSDAKKRGFAKYLTVISIEFIAESFPGISMLPWAVIFATILYFCVLLERYLAKQEQKTTTGEKTTTQSIPAYAAADGYYDNERMAA